MTTNANIKQHIADHLKFPIEKLDNDRPLLELIADSFLLIEMMLTLQEKLDVVLLHEDIANVVTINDLVLAIVGKLPAASSIVYREVG